MTTALPVSAVRSVGIDVAKRTLAVAALMQDRSHREFVADNSEEGIGSLSKSLADIGVGGSVPLVLESTGDCHLLASVMLREAGFRTVCINPLITKEYQRSSVRGAKTDRVDARRLATIGEREALRDFTASRKDIETRKILSSLAKMHDVRQRLCVHLSSTRETAQTLGIAIGLDHAEKAVEEIDAQMRELEERLIERMHPGLRMLAEETKGVSLRAAAILSGFLSGKRFDSRDALVAFAGLDVKARRSGQWRGKERLSKRGDPFLRRTVYHIGWGLALHNDDYRTYYANKRTKDNLHHTAAIMACGRKFLRTVYAHLYGKKSCCDTFPQSGVEKVS
jgi:transposase